MAINILSAEGRQRLRAFCARPTLFAFDYDGTLAALVDDAASATMRPRTAALLKGIAARAKTAVITGRSCVGVGRFLGPEITYVVGNHGMEGLPGGERRAAIARAAALGWRRHLDGHKFADPKIFVEVKEFSLTLHSRGSVNPAAAQAEILAVVGELTPPPRLVLGKDVVNLVEASMPNKGDAMRQLLTASGCEVGIFVGDDMTDEDVFDLEDARIFGIRVVPREASKATYFIPQQTDIEELLQLLSEVAPAGG